MLIQCDKGWPRIITSAISQWKFLRTAILQSYGAFFGVSQRRLLESSLAAAAPLTWVESARGGYETN